jgi:small subunit ribosomal protein S8
MSVSDTIGDMFTRIRNAHAARRPVVEVAHSRLKGELAKILKKEGFIADFTTETDGPRRWLRIYLKYGPDETPVIHGLQRVSRPGRRCYVAASDVPRVLNGIGVAILTTSAGLMTDRQARRLRVGGEVICQVW